MHWLHGVAFAAVCSWLCAGGARAQTDTAPPDSSQSGAEPAATPVVAAQPGPPPRVLSLTVSGGVSLGAFEAGVLYFLTESIKRSTRDVDLRIATGASAGSANALISLMDSCLEPLEDPTRSLGFQTWIPVGIAQLFVPERVTATSVLTREPLERAMGKVRDRWLKGLRADCDVVLGVSVTRKVPHLTALTKQDLGTAVQVPRSDERFVVRIRGRGPGRTPIVENYVESESVLGQPLLPLSTERTDSAQASNFEYVLDLLYASAAFPLAFEPYPLAHCQTDPATVTPSRAKKALSCTRPTTDLFIDGGVFDNSPLRLNYREVQRALRPGEGRAGRWLDYGEPAAGAPPPVRYIYVDPSASAYPALDQVVQDEVPPNAFDLLSELAGNFIETSRRRELLALLEDSSEATGFREQMVLTENQLPTISSQLGAFFGFFERDFRELDFYLGMYDGLVNVRRALQAQVGLEAAEQSLERTFPVLSRPFRRDLPKGLRPFACLLSQVETSYAGHAVACEGDELRNFRILLQVTLDRLHVACSRVREQDLPSQASPLCFAASRGKPRVRVRGVTPLPASRCARLEAEQDFSFTLRLLSEYGFEYRDLKLSPKQAHRGEIEIRRTLLSMSEALADQQPTAVGKAIVATAGRAGANQIAYEPPTDWLYLTAGTTLEAGVSFMPFGWDGSWARLNLALQIGHWETIVTPDRFAMSFSPLIGPEFQLLFMSNAALQNMLGFRVGYQAAWPDRFGFEGCDDEASDGDARLCSQLVLQVYIASAIVERLRGQLVLEYFPLALEADFDSRLALQLSFGLQLF
jgi:Patatin-like phospholipase